MERKHQVFVSSTYKDLIEERQHVIHALLELDCIPAGMELFPATDEDAWTLIKEVIDNSDYYLLIIAGKYGSVSNQNISYTEMEFDYAVKRHKPIMCFLHHDIDELKGTKIEKKEEIQKKLSSFRAKAQEKHCKFWFSSEDLGGKVSRSLVQMKKRHPSDGWVPGRYAADEKLFRTIEELRATIHQLETEKSDQKNLPPVEAQGLSQGVENYLITTRLNNLNAKNTDTTLYATWDTIFSYVGTSMIGECTTQEFRDKLQLVYWHAVDDEIVEMNDHDKIIIKHVDFDTIAIQLQALGLITYGTKKRPVSDINTYWKLTPYGEHYLLKVRAIKAQPL